jgi:small subunit ribosomal protein S6
MEMKQYETVFILTPVLSDTQMKDAVDKFRSIIKDSGAEIVNEESWGLRKLAYEIQHKSNGFYTLFEYKANPEFIASLETEFRRDETILRFLTVALDKHAIEFNERRRKGDFKKKEEPKEEAAS